MPTNVRDIALCAVGIVAIVALVLVQRYGGDQSGEIITGIVALGGMALGRLSGANTTASGGDSTAPADLSGAEV